MFIYFLIISHLVPKTFLTMYLMKLSVLLLYDYCDTNSKLIG